ncbi:hypothetical protein GCM10011348_14410 [Marinobacterium nitratireducens]|uniref:Uncharacterized protein n=1 Tax=Marinobacterium nitratireducens TaxID=518897 RepID=A0A918DRM3_9GAMM|nr:hypothetical protein [Marinobacterium nitratireducens]GGO79639.1 hypothetical protein GCM10011348_14410 [Marinobacterium nitratireducens]
MTQDNRNSGFFAAKRQRRWRGLVIVAGLMLSLLAWHSVLQTQERQAVEQFNRDISVRF